jgi:kinesin family protein 4/21/27
MSTHKEHRIYCTWLAFVTAFRATGEIPVGAYKLLLNCITWLIDIRSSKQKGYEIATRDFANLVNCVKTAGGLVVMGVGGFFAPETVFGSLSNMPQTAENQLKSKIAKLQTNLGVISQKLCDAKTQLASLKRPHEGKQVSPARAPGSPPSSSAAADDELDDAPEIEARRLAAASASDGEAETPEVTARRLEALVKQLQAQESGLRTSIGECNTTLKELRAEIANKRSGNHTELANLVQQQAAALQAKRDDHARQLTELDGPHQTAVAAKKAEQAKELTDLDQQNAAALQTKRDEHARQLTELAGPHQTAVTAKKAEQAEELTGFLDQQNAAALQAKREEHARQLTELDGPHQTAVAAKKAEQAKELTDLDQQNAAALQAKRDAHARQLTELDGPHQTAVAAKKAEQDKELTGLDQQHKDALQAMQSEKSKALEDLQKEYQDASQKEEGAFKLQMRGYRESAQTEKNRLEAEMAGLRTTKTGELDNEMRTARETRMQTLDEEIRTTRDDRLKAVDGVIAEYKRVEEGTYHAELATLEEQRKAAKGRKEEELKQAFETLQRGHDEKIAAEEQKYTANLRRCEQEEAKLPDRLEKARKAADAQLNRELEAKRRELAALDEQHKAVQAKKGDEAAKPTAASAAGTGEVDLATEKKRLQTWADSLHTQAEDLKTREAKVAQLEMQAKRKKEKKAQKKSEALAVAAEIDPGKTSGASVGRKATDERKKQDQALAQAAASQVVLRKSQYAAAAVAAPGASSEAAAKSVASPANLDEQK